MLAASQASSEVGVTNDTIPKAAREQALLPALDAFAPADGSTPDQWLAAAHRYRHVYQRAADERQPIFVERDQIASGLGHNRPDEAGV